jgi:hypothetical protein
MFSSSCINHLSCLAVSDKTYFLFAVMGVLAPDFGLFFARLMIKNQMTPLFRDKNNLILYLAAFFSIYGQTREEFYQYFAMLWAAGSIFALMIIELLKWFFRY